MTSKFVDYDKYRRERGHATQTVKVFGKEYRASLEAPYGLILEYMDAAENGRPVSFETNKNALVAALGEEAFQEISSNPDFHFSDIPALIRALWLEGEKPEEDEMQTEDDLAVENSAAGAKKN